jgi:hypothetical protein
MHKHGQDQDGRKGSRKKLKNGATTPRREKATAGRAAVCDDADA